jgi:hypothetical protein
MFIVVDRDTRLSSVFPDVHKNDFAPLIKRWLRNSRTFMVDIPRIRSLILVQNSSTRSSWKNYPKMAFSSCSQLQHSMISIIWNAVLAVVAHSGVPIQV